MDGFFRNFGNLGDFATLALLRVAPALFCITIHELAHGFTAYKLGDPTAKNLGRLTLNPIKHIDPVGLLMMLTIGFGWAKPVPVDMRNFKHPKWYMAVTALAGPISNLILAAIVMFILGLVSTSLGFLRYDGRDYNIGASDMSMIIYTIINFTVFLNIALAVFNMLPIPPLDGSKVLFSLLPEKQYYTVLKYERFGMIFLLVIMFSQLLFNIDIFSRTIGFLARTVVGGYDIFYNLGFAISNGLGA
ncbi:MAG: site-2 protease family protein [Oscillospiraceae bacterium]|nr:site-2 protease family protein [Oscillospiraceae bacterium]